MLDAITGLNADTGVSELVGIAGYMASFVFTTYIEEFPSRTPGIYRGVRRPDNVDSHG